MLVLKYKCVVVNYTCMFVYVCVCVYICMDPCTKSEDVSRVG